MLCQLMLDNFSCNMIEENKDSNSEEDEQTVQELIETAGTTQAKVAYNLDVSLNTVNSWFNRRKVPRADNFFALCRELNVSPKRLGRMLGIDIAGIPDDEPIRRSPTE